MAVSNVIAKQNNTERTEGPSLCNRRYGPNVALIQIVVTRSMPDRYPHIHHMVKGGL